MKRAALLAPGLALALWLAGAIVLSAHHWALVAAWWLAGAGLGAWAVAWQRAAWAGRSARMADAIRALTGTASAPDLVPEGPDELRELAEAVNSLATVRRELGATMAEQVQAASNRVGQQRDQLATLMAQLHHAVVACNREGRILLYNERALRLSRALSRTPGQLQGVELIGLGRSIHALIDAAAIEHALEIVAQRHARGDAASAVRFVATTPGGHLLQVNAAPVHPVDDTGVEATDAQATGYILMLDDITREQETQGRRDRILIELTEASRSSFAAIQAALDMLDYPDLQPAERENFQVVLRQEVAGMSARLDRLGAEASADQRVRWPLQGMRGIDLATAAAQRIRAHTGHSVDIVVEEETLWLRVDSLALIQALVFLSVRLLEGTPAELRLRLAPAGKRAHLDLAWRGAEIDLESLRRWQTEATGPGPAPTVREVAERHGGELWLERTPGPGPNGGDMCYRFLLPQTSVGDAPQAAGSRPAYYDFDLFAASADSHSLDNRLLSELSFTVFDTETTGLDPAGGDEIIQIGAIRIVNGKLLASERFDQLVNPRRTIPDAGFQIHGISLEMVRGQPGIDQILPAFHAFASDTVLVGHNAAFDMRFLALKEDSSGVRFDQPVLDTLLLASLAWPNEPNHGLETISARLGVEVAGRHTALGDARATAEVFLGLIPLLRERGITTLGQARAASQESFYAALRY
ncbi:exonuclease domain-containing protein [Luteimonas sp. A478]